MRKLTSHKLLMSIAALALVLIAGLVSFAYLWPSKPVLKLSGEVQAREIHNASRLGGRIKKIYVREGQTVKQGDLLIDFESTDLQAKIEDAKATLSQALAQEQLLTKGAPLGAVRQASSTVKQAQERVKILSKGARPEELIQLQSKVQIAQSQFQEAGKATENARLMLDEGIISRQKFNTFESSKLAAKNNLDAARAALAMAKSGGRPEDRAVASAQLSAAKAQYGEVLDGAKPEEVSIASSNVEKARSSLKALEAQLNEVRIKAPFPGFISVIGVTEGELVPPGRPVITILDYANLWADVFVPESRLELVSLGRSVSVQAKSYRNKEFQGRIALINPKSEFIPNSGGDSSTDESTFRIKVAIANKDKSGQASLYPGMKIDVLLTK